MNVLKAMQAAALLQSATLTDSTGVTVGTAKDLVVTQADAAAQDFHDATGFSLTRSGSPVTAVRLAWWQRPEFQRGKATINGAKVKNQARGSTQSRKDKAAHRARALYAKETCPAVISEAYIDHATALLDNAARRAWGAGISSSKGLGATGRKLNRLKFRSAT